MSKLKPIIQWTPALYSFLSKHYDRLAAWLFPIGDAGREKVVSGLASGRILDVACGTGTLLEKAHQRGLRCVGVDTSWGMLQETKRKVPAAGVVQASFLALPFAKEQFDYVVETNAVSAAEVDAGAALGEMNRVCASGGEIRIGDYARSQRQGLWLGWIAKIGILVGDYPHDYKGLLEAMGYQVDIEELGWGGMYQFIRARLSIQAA